MPPPPVPRRRRESDPDDSDQHSPVDRRRWPKADLNSEKFELLRPRDGTAELVVEEMFTDMMKRRELACTSLCTFLFSQLFSPLVVLESHWLYLREKVDNKETRERDRKKKMHFLSQSSQHDQTTRVAFYSSYLISFTMLAWVALSMHPFYSSCRMIGHLS